MLPIFSFLMCVHLAHANTVFNQNFSSPSDFIKQQKEAASIYTTRPNQTPEPTETPEPSDESMNHTPEEGAQENSF